MNRPHVHIPYSKIQDYLDLIRDQKLNIEIYFSGDVLDSIRIDEVRRVKEMLDYGPSLSFHAPFMDLSPGAVDALVRTATTKRLHQALDIAEILKPKAMVCHSGYEKWRYALKVNWWLDQSLLTWRPVNARAAEIGTKIAIENIFEDEPSSLKMLMQAMDSDNFGICFDTGHCNLFSTVRLEDWMDALNPHIIELHLHDNDRSSDQHLPAGEGTFDFKKFFYLLNRQDCIYTVETHAPEKVTESLLSISRLTAA